MWALCGLLAACLLSCWRIIVVDAGPIADYLADVGLGAHGDNFEKALASSEWKGHGLSALISMETYELGELCTEADMGTKDAIKLSRAMRKSRRSTLDSPQRGVHRPDLRHQRAVPVRPSLPRIHVDEIDVNPDYEIYRRREHPFILTGAMDTWKATETWTTLSHLSDLMPNEVTDFYPHNMLSTDRQNPYLTRLGRAIQTVQQGPRDSAPFDYDPSAQEGRYMHLQLTPPTWRLLEENQDVDPDRHWHLKGDEWMAECMPDPDLQSEFHLKTHWQIILIGSRGAGMFNHSDALLTSSWHGTVLGTKWWYVCKGECYESYVKVGEILYYGAGWYHETQNLEAPTATITGTVVHEWNYNTVARMLHLECSESKLKFKFSAKLCDALDKCYNHWHEKYTGKSKPADILPEWRSVSSQENIDTKEKIRPQDNNYDGREFITE